MRSLPSGLVPQEDQGVFFAEVRAPEGCTLYETQEIVKKVEEKVKKIPELESYAVVSGYGMMAGRSGSCYATLIIRLKNWDDRSGMNHNIMLIGLLAKTAILITEFASERRAQGMSIRDAAFAACEERLRPILMTVVTMIAGMIPLIIAGGAGATR